VTLPSVYQVKGESPRLLQSSIPNALQMPTEELQQIFIEKGPHMFDDGV